MRKLLLKRYPDLATVPADAALGMDTPLPMAPVLDWSSVDWGIVPRSAEVSASQAADGEGEPASALADEEDVQGNGWADVALWLGGDLMEGIRKSVEDQLGYTTSAVRSPLAAPTRSRALRADSRRPLPSSLVQGIAHNKVLSKLCSAFKKPRAQTVLRTSAVAGFLRPMKFQKVRRIRALPLLSSAPLTKGCAHASRSASWAASSATRWRPSTGP